MARPKKNAETMSLYAQAERLEKQLAKLDAKRAEILKGVPISVTKLIELNRELTGSKG